MHGVRKNGMPKWVCGAASIFWTLLRSTLNSCSSSSKSDSIPRNGFPKPLGFGLSVGVPWVCSACGFPQPLSVYCCCSCCCCCCCNFQALFENYLGSWTRLQPKQKITRRRTLLHSWTYVMDQIRCGPDCHKSDVMSVEHAKEIPKYAATCLDIHQFRVRVDMSKQQVSRRPDGKWDKIAVQFSAIRRRYSNAPNPRRGASSTDDCVPSCQPHSALEDWEQDHPETVREMVGRLCNMAE